MHWRARRLLAALPDGLLPLATRDRLQAHLERCPACRSELRALERSEALLRLLPRAIAAAAAAGEVDGERRLSVLARWTRRRPLPVRPRALLPGAVSSLLAMACVVLFVGAGQHSGIEADDAEAFNFVLAGNFRPADEIRPSPARIRSSPVSEPIQLARHQPDAYYLPIGVR